MVLSFQLPIHDIIRDLVPVPNVPTDQSRFKNSSRDRPASLMSFDNNPLPIVCGTVRLLRSGCNSWMQQHVMTAIATLR